MSKNFWVIGPGPSLLKYKNQINKLKGKNIFVFQNVFPLMLNYFDIQPTYWMWQDPQASKKGMHYLNKNKNTNLISLSPYPVCSEFMDTKNIKDFEKYFQGGLPYPNKGRCTEAPDNLLEWELLLNNYKTLQEENRIQSLPTTSLSHLLRTKPLDEVKNIMKPENRFNYKDVIFGTDIYKNNWYMRENKLSFCILPALQKLGAKKVFIMGFDGLWGRFYDKNWKTKGFVGEYKFLNKWVEWQHITKMELYSVTDCQINNHIKYMDFEKALEIDNETNN
jgi:hypothetical protein